MEDRYLFKAKRIDKGEWVQGYLFDDGFENGKIFIGGLVIEEYNGTACDDWNITGIDFYEVDPSTICQCTGLKDKNGKLIWESDVVKKEFYTDYDNCANSEEYIGIVKVADCARLVENIRGKCTRSIFEAMSYWEDVKYFEVIGNVFDNPELLEGGE